MTSKATERVEGTPNTSPSSTPERSLGSLDSFLETTQSSPLTEPPSVQRKLRQGLEQQLSPSIVRTLVYGFTFRNKDLFPVYNHKRHTLFNKEKISELAEQNLINVSTTKTDIISGADQDEFTKDFGQKMGISIDAVGGVAKAEFKATRSSTKNKMRNKTKVFSQNRISVTKKFLHLDGSSSTEEELEQILDSKSYQSMMNIKSSNDADEFLSKYGKFFITKAHIGGLRIYESQDTKSLLENLEENSSGISMTGALSPELQLGAENSNSSRKYVKKYSENAMKIGMTIGGSSEYFKSCVEHWIQSINEGNYEICQCQFDPVYALIARDATDVLLKIRQLLKDAHHMHIANEEENEQGCKIQNGRRYLIESAAYEGLYISSETDTLESRDVILKMVESKSMAQNEIEANRDSMLFKVTGNPNMIGRVNETDNVLATSMAILLEDSNGYFVGRHRRNVKRGPKMSKTDRSEMRNQWHLKEVPFSNEMCLVLSKDCKHVLGIKRLPTDNDGRFKYVLTVEKYKEGSPRNDSTVMWKFVQNDGLMNPCPLSSTAKKVREEKICSSPLVRRALQGRAIYSPMKMKMRGRWQVESASDDDGSNPPEIIILD